ncbi:Cyanidin 3-O-rutinoside 5-O-glucosyltransferase [Platanthera guangdongensis]|uniref:Cyanidin 3-O-rutinoside 5-O-glucosyltransferase n=1 Tax=Platanthera guangdongensis TaxID=2320717 RepID=A0ABR2M491_9ASPA
MSTTVPPPLHFLMVSLAAQGQINPIRNLARRLATLAGARVTIATPLSLHRRLFPASTTPAGEPDDAAQEVPLNPKPSGIISYAPYSDGFDAGFDFHAGPADLLSPTSNRRHRTLSALAQALAARGRPVTCVVHTLTITCAVDLARDLGWAGAGEELGRRSGGLYGLAGCAETGVGGVRGVRKHYEARWPGRGGDGEGVEGERETVPLGAEKGRRKQGGGGGGGTGDDGGVVPAGEGFESRAVGCFATHCGWNSMTEAVIGGVPMVMLPEWIDQTTNAALAERVWGLG